MGVGNAYVFLELASNLAAEPVEIAIVLQLGYDVVFANTVVVSAFHDSSPCTGFFWSQKECTGSEAVTL